jgi:ABC-type polysaccharide/polyol phosphate export permease
MGIQEETMVYDSAQLATPAIEEARSILRYRALVLQFVRRDLVARYKRSILGVTWTMLNPLATMIILSVVFSQIFKTDHTFPVYIMAGLVAWGFFSQTTSDSMYNLIGGVSLLQRIYMPPTVFAVSAIGNGLINLLISLIPLSLVMLVLGVPIHLSILFLPVSILALAMFSLGVGLLVSTLAVYFRDVTALYQVVLTAWMYLTPIIYPENLLNPRFRFWVSALNPMWPIVHLFRVPLYEGRLPSLAEIWPALAVGLAVLILGWVVFTLRSKEFPYRI